MEGISTVGLWKSEILTLMLQVSIFLVAGKYLGVGCGKMLRQNSITHKNTLISIVAIYMPQNATNIWQKMDPDLLEDYRAIFRKSVSPPSFSTI